MFNIAVVEAMCCRQGSWRRCGSYSGRGGDVFHIAVVEAMCFI